MLLRRKETYEIKKKLDVDKIDILNKSLNESEKRHLNNAYLKNKVANADISVRYDSSAP